MSDREVVIEVRGLKTRLGNFWVHQDVNLTAYRGEVLSIIGTSGGGKTTLLREMTGLRRPQGGEVRVFGHDIHALSWEQEHALRKRWGLLFQQGALFSALTVFDNVAFPLRELRSVGEEIDERLVRDLVMLKLEMAGLSAKVANMRPAELSGGMTKRVSLARALAIEPELLFLDEPTSGLDPVTADELDILLRDLHQDLGLTIVQVSHDLQSVLSRSDRVAILAEGQIVFEDDLDKLISGQETLHPAVQHLFANQRSQDLFRIRREAL